MQSLIISRLRMPGLRKTGPRHTVSIEPLIQANHCEARASGAVESKDDEATKVIPRNCHPSVKSPQIPIQKPRTYGKWRTKINMREHTNMYEYIKTVKTKQKKNKKQENPEGGRRGRQEPPTTQRNPKGKARKREPS